MRKVIFEDDAEFNRACVLHGEYLEESGTKASPEMSMHLEDGAELTEMSKRFERERIRYSVEQ